MDGNPYSALLRALRPDRNGKRLGMRLGTVTSAAPLSVRVAGLDLPESAFRVTVATHYVQVAAAKPEFAAGEKLLLLTEDDQTFYIMAKVVDAE